MDYLLDTNILLVYVRGNLQARNLEKDLRILTGENRVVISVVSEGEIKSLAIQNNWGSRKLAKLEELLNRFLIADINVEELIDKYAEIDAYSQGKLPGKKVNFSSKNMGKNDLWIAATGNVLNLVLITADGDFDHLEPEYLVLKKVDFDNYLTK